MAVNRETVRLNAELALIVDDRLSEMDRQLAISWARAWRVAEQEWRAACARLARDIQQQGRPRRSTLRRMRYVAQAIRNTKAALDQIIASTGATLVGSTADLIRETARMQARIIGSQLPRGSAERAAAEARQLPDRQLTAMVRRTTQQITSTLRPLSAEATEAVLDQLLVGAIRGQNPNRTAAEMLRQVRGVFDSGRFRATVIARTEALDAHRAAAMAAQNKHLDVLSGWRWVAKLETRTCPACWGMHGTTHRLDESGPLGHQQCRCSRVPVTKTWAELGIDQPEPPSLIQDGERAFDRLPAAQQLEIMGPTRLQALRSGAADWTELARLRENRGWRDAYYVRPVDDFRRRMNRSA